MELQIPNGTAASWGEIPQCWSSDLLGCHGINAGKVTAAAWMSPGREGEPAFNILGLVLVISPSESRAEVQAGKSSEGK